MPEIKYSEITIADPNNLSDITTLDVDPNTYDPFSAPVRGSTFETLDGSVVRQVFGVFPADMTISLQGEITLETVKELWTKYINKGKTWLLTDWYNNKFLVIFKPGVDAFHPVPLHGGATFFTFSMTLQVCSVAQWFGSAYG